MMFEEFEKRHPSITGMLRINKFITENCLGCVRGNALEGFYKGDCFYCPIINTLEKRIGYNEGKLSKRMIATMRYPEGPCRNLLKGVKK